MTLEHIADIPGVDLQSARDSVNDIDFDWLKDIFKLSVNQQQVEVSEAKPTPLPAQHCKVLKDEEEQQVSEWRSLGLSLCTQGHVAYLILAGGQGTRLGSSLPKGCFDIQLPSGQSLYALHCRRVLKLRSISGGSIPVYVMTSPPTHEATVSFFESNGFFGLPSQDVVFFQQGTLPCVDFEGNALLSSSSTVARSPDGNGGIYRALKDTGSLDDMRKRGVEVVHVSSIDNALILPADPVFVGYFRECGAEAGAKAVPKQDAKEAVGVFALHDGKARVVEYSELSAEAAAETEPDTGRLKLREGNICNHIYTVDFLEKAATVTIPYHIAKKKIAHIGADGALVQPEKPNGIKLETFIFDVFSQASPFVVMEVAREEEFAPVKNASGDSSPESARKMIDALHRQWAVASGATVSGDGLLEVSADLSYGGEALDGLKGQAIEAPTYLQSI